MRIVFMGTPDFAVESLKTLVDKNYQVVGVVTMPDKPSGRGYKLQYSAVKQYALEKNIPILQPEKLKDEIFLNQLKELNADVQVVVAFRMLPEVVWDMPLYGTFNLHASLLPQYRGAAPINHALMNGETETGVTTFFLTHEIDTGKIILQDKIAIHQEDNAGTVHDKLKVIGANLVTKTIDLLMDGKIDTIDQSQFINSETELKPAPKIFKENCQIDFSTTVDKVHNFVRGLSPHPTAWTEIQLPGSTEKTLLKVFETSKEYVEHNVDLGKIITDAKTYLKIAANGGYVHLKSIQLPGKKRMDVTDLLRGLRF